MTGTPPIVSTSTPALIGTSGASGSAGPRPVTEVIRSEERVHVGHAVRVSSRAVLRKYVVTETVTQTFQLRHEEVRLDLEPVADPEARPDEAGRSLAEVGFGEERFVEVILHREVPVVQLRVEATERVRLHVDTVTEQRAVSADVRHDHVDLDAPAG